MPFTPGVSGNPKGRPRNAGQLGALRKRIEARTPEIIDRLVQVKHTQGTEGGSAFRPPARRT